ncbi:MAG: methionine--tRNA ligase [Oscillospiraceae bacterium]|nr:methionine--tRNA ligase [Oscillospiraceae bacterium]
MNDKKFYITTPIYFPSAKLHIGHTYTTVAADVVARYKRLKGFDVMFLTGTDEHGQKIETIATDAGKTPKEYVDEIVDSIKKLWSVMNISYDRFIRTTDDYHIESVQKIFQELYNKNKIYKSVYSGKYCSPCESFWTKSQLKDGKCPDCGREVIDATEEAYFFKLSEYSDKLLELYKNNPEFIQPTSRMNEMINNFIKPGLEDLCVSRSSFKWGIPVPFDDNHVIYVWVDALTNYITALGYKNNKYNDFDKYWPCDVHLMAKEIVRFHTIIWPAMLMALDLPLPKKIFGHGWLLFDGDKMSKSKGNIIDPTILCEKYGVDSIRYYLLREIPFGSDNSFDNKALINRVNSDLANDLGNLVSRTISMIEKYFDGVLIKDHESGSFDDELKSVCLESKKIVEEYLENLQFSSALTQIFKIASRANKYIDETTPWVLAKSKENKNRLACVLYNLSESIRIISILLTPFLPDTSKKIQDQININNNIINWEDSEKWGLLDKDLKTGKKELLFPRIEVEK